MSDLVTKELMESVLAIAEQAGEAIKVVYDQADPVTVHTKSDDSPVTAADHAAHHVVFRRCVILINPLCPRSCFLRW